MIIITGTVSLREDAREKAIKLGQEHSARSREEPGCISHDCYIATDDANCLHFFEQWEDIAAVQRHFAVPESGDFVEQIGQMASAAPQIAMYNASPLENTPF